MLTDDLDYELPAGLIAQTPVEPRDASRLLVVSGRGPEARLADRAFTDLPRLLRAGDVLVRNDTRVLPARAHFRRATGGRIELLFLEPAHEAGDPSGDGHPAEGRGGGPAEDGGTVRSMTRTGSRRLSRQAAVPEWEVLVRGKVREGETLVSECGGDEFRVEMRRRLGDGRWLVGSLGPEPPQRLLERYGDTPLPPYIKTRLEDPDRYQTVYAAAEGSAAAPTAGLHFTAAVDAALVAAGVTIEHLTLHVGLATFRPVTVEVLEDHPLHDEPFTVRHDVWTRIAAAVDEGRRVVAVGTTMVRLLEELGQRDVGDALDWQDGVARGRTELFVTPGYEFRVVGGMLTNFHLPRTSLLGLVMAFCGVEETRRAYAHAIAADYRFYSFGDAMLGLP